MSIKNPPITSGWIPFGNKTFGVESKAPKSNKPAHSSLLLDLPTDTLPLFWFEVCVVPVIMFGAAVSEK